MSWRRPRDYGLLEFTTGPRAGQGTGRRQRQLARNTVTPFVRFELATSIRMRPQTTSSPS